MAFPVKYMDTELKLFLPILAPSSHTKNELSQFWANSGKRYISILVIITKSDTMNYEFVWKYVDIFLLGVLKIFFSDHHFSS